jgi:hypothetical protein
MLIIGTHFFAWGSTYTNESLRCGQCGAVAPFVQKSGMRFLTLFFIIPVFPLSRTHHLLECPRCHTRYQTMARAA